MKRPNCPKCSRPMDRAGFTMNEKTKIKKQRYKCKYCKYFPTLGDGRKGRINKKTGTRFGIPALVLDAEKIYMRIDRKEVIKLYENNRKVADKKNEELEKEYTSLFKKKRWRKALLEYQKKRNKIWSVRHDFFEKNKGILLKRNKVDYIKFILMSQLGLEVSHSYIYQILKKNKKVLNS